MKFTKRLALPETYNPSTKGRPWFPLLLDGCLYLCICFPSQLHVHKRQVTCLSDLCAPAPRRLTGLQNCLLKEQWNEHWCSLFAFTSLRTPPEFGIQFTSLWEKARLLISYRSRWWRDFRSCSMGSLSGNPLERGLPMEAHFPGPLGAPGAHLRPALEACHPFYRWGEWGPETRGQAQVHTDRDCMGGDLSNSIIK